MIKKIKILHIGMSSNIGGIENYIMSIFRNIDKELYEFSFLTYGVEKLAYEDEILALGGTIYRLNNPRKRLFNKKHHNELKKFYNKHHFDVVEKHIVDLYDIESIKMAKRCNIQKRIIHSHAAGYYGKPTLFVKTCILINKLSYKKYVTDVVGCSKESLLFTFGNDNGIVVNNGVDQTRFFYNEDDRNNFRKKYLIKENVTVLLNVGRLHKTKNQIFLLDVFASYQQLDKNALLVIAGDGPELDNLKLYCKAKEIADRVIFLGNVESLNEVYCGSDLFVFPSKTEGYGITIIEAMFTGLKCFCSDIISDEIADDLVYKISLDNSSKKWANYIYAEGTRENVRVTTHPSRYTLNYTMQKIYDLYKIS